MARNDVRSSPYSRPSSFDVRFRADFVCFTSRSGPTRRCPRSSAFDPKRTFMALGVADHIWTIGELVEAATNPESVSPRYAPFTVIDGGLS